MGRLRPDRRVHGRLAMANAACVVAFGAMGAASCVRGGFADKTSVFSHDGPLPGIDALPPSDASAGDLSAADGSTSWPGCVADVAVSTLSTCVLFRDGHVECTGFNVRGQLGDGTTTTHRKLAPAVGLSDVVRVDAAAWGYCAVRADATAWCWGDPSSGRFGSLGPDYVTVPTRVPELSNVRELEGGSTSSCAVLGDRSVVCMGANGASQLGDPNATGGPTPVAVALPLPVLELASCWGGVAVVLADGSVSSWGYDGATQHATPDPLGVDGVVEISAHAPAFFARRLDGSIMAWGRNSNGELGRGTTSAREEPAPVSGITNAISVAGGGTHACAVLAGGAVRCWGENGTSLKLGVDGVTQSSTPLPVTGLPAARVVRAGQEHSCAIVEDGAIWCWGHNSTGQLGLGSASEGELPTRMPIVCP